MTTATTQQNIYEIDAQGKTLGRVATEAATALRGKNTPQFKPHVAPDIAVRVVNASQLLIDNRKKNEKYYKSHSQYPGSLKRETLGRVIERKGYGEVVRRAVYGMLPANKLRAVMMKHLSIEE